MELTKAFEAAGFRPRKPLAAKTRQQLFSRLGCPMPPEVEAFYEQCNGGRIPGLACRFYPLSEAVEIAGYYDFKISLRILPFFVSEENESDPCVVGLEPPLTGYVFQLCHDFPSRVLAPSLSSFLKSLASQEADDAFSLEDATLVYPKALSKAERKTVADLLARSRMDLEVEDEPALLVQLALSMLTDEECVSALGEADHPYHNARFLMTARLRQIGTPAAQALLDQAERELGAFVQQAIRVLTEAGLNATTERGTDLRISGKLANVGAFYDRRESPDCWEYLVERARVLFGGSAPAEEAESEPTPEGPGGETDDLTADAQRRMKETVDLDKALEAVGFRPRKPLVATSRQRFFSRLGGEMPPDVEAFYERCNGGSVALPNCRVLPLAEAMEFAEDYEFLTSLRVLPFFVFEDEDYGDHYCLVGLEPPLSGHVLQLPDDGPTRVLAPSIPSFLALVASPPRDWSSSFEEATFLYPSALSNAERKTVWDLLVRSTAESTNEDDPLVFAELALSMLTDTECVSILSEFTHPDWYVRGKMLGRLREIGTPEAAALVERQTPTMEEFVEGAVRALTEAGLDATTTDGADLRVSGEPIDVERDYEWWHSPGCWGMLVRRIRELQVG